MSALMPGEDTRVYEHINEEYFAEHGHCADNPVTGLGSGDSMLFLDVLPPELVDDSFDTMNTEIEWNIMNHKGETSFISHGKSIVVVSLFSIMLYKLIDTPDTLCVCFCVCDDQAVKSPALSPFR
jgi:hypothetical protein